MTRHKVVGPKARRLRVRLCGHYSDQALTSLTVELRHADGAALVAPALPRSPRSPELQTHDAHLHFVALLQTTATITQMQEDAISQPRTEQVYSLARLVRLRAL